MYKLVIFDFDGTLADSFPWFLNAINSMAQRYRFKPIDLNRLDEFRGYSGRQMMKELGIPWWKVPFIANELRRQMRQVAHQIKPFDGAETLLHQLHEAGIEIAIVTSNSRQNVEAILGAETLALITTIEGGAAMYGKKRKFRSVLKKHDYTAADALSIGDEIRDAEASSACGIDFIGVTWGFTHADELQKYTKLKICGTIDELLSRITTINV